MELVPTTIMIRNSSRSYALKEFKIFVSVDNQVFEEWVHIDEILQTSKNVQRFDLDAASVQFINRRKYRYFRLCSMQNCGGYHIIFSEFGILAVALSSDPLANGQDVGFVDSLKVDQYSNGCVFVDDIPSREYPFCVGHKVQFDDGAKGEISRLTADKVCVKIKNEKGEMMSFCWISRVEASKQITLLFHDEPTLRNYDFAVILDENDNSSVLNQNIPKDVVDGINCPLKCGMKNFTTSRDGFFGGTACDVCGERFVSGTEMYRCRGDCEYTMCKLCGRLSWQKISVTFSKFNKFLLPCTGLLTSKPKVNFIGIYARPRIEGYKWARIKTMKYEVVNVSFQDGHETASVANRLVHALLVNGSEIRDREHAFHSIGLRMEQSDEWMPQIAANPQLFAVTAYRRKLVIERLIIELKLWSTEWIHRILEQKMKDKPMLQWLVEDRRVSQLYDHYQILTSRFKEYFCPLLNRRWLRFQQNVKMEDEPGFDSATYSCFESTEYLLDDTVCFCTKKTKKRFNCPKRKSAGVNLGNAIAKSIFGSHCKTGPIKCGLDPMTFFKSHWCDVCRKKCLSESRGLRCRSCDYDVCRACAPPHKWKAMIFEVMIPAVSGSIRQITVSNSSLLGSRPVVLQEFQQKDGDDLVDALRFDGEFVFLNHVPSALYPFRIGQDVQCNDSVGIVTRVRAHDICVKFTGKDGMVFFRWFERVRIPMELTLRFYHEKELKNYYFAVSVDGKDSSNLSEKEFDDIKTFKLSCGSLNINERDPVFVYAKPIKWKIGSNIDYEWACIKTLYPVSDSLLDDVANLQGSGSHVSDKVFHFLSWLRQRETKIKDNKGILERFGLRMGQADEWMPLIAAHSQIFALSAYRRVLLVERLITEFDLLSIGMVHRLMKQRKNKKSMLEYLVENRKVRRLYDHYRVSTSGFKVHYRSTLLDRTWMKFHRNTKMHSPFDQTEYFVNGIGYPIDTTICVEGLPHQICRNAVLFGQQDVGIELPISRSIVIERTISAISSVKKEAPEHHVSRFQRITASQKSQRLMLSVIKHKGHQGSRHPNGLLRSGTSTYYQKKGSWHEDKEDWIVFQQLTADMVPTSIGIRNRDLKEIKIFGSADNESFEEWVHIDGILRTSDRMQYLDLDPATVYFAWSRGFQYFRLCPMDCYSYYKMIFYEFCIRGVSVHRQTQTKTSSNFIEALNIDENDVISLCPPESDYIFGIGREVEFKANNRWIEGLVSRELKSKICVQYHDECTISYRWIHREEIQTKLRLFIEDRKQISEHTFAAAVGQVNEAPIFFDEFTFDRCSDFAIPVNRLVSPSIAPDVIYLYAKTPKRKFNCRKKCGLKKYTTCSAGWQRHSCDVCRGSILLGTTILRCGDCNYDMCNNCAPIGKAKDMGFELIKQIKSNGRNVNAFGLDGAADVDRHFAVKSPIACTPFGCRFEIFATSDIVIGKTGIIEVFRNFSDVTNMEFNQQNGNDAIPIYGKSIGNSSFSSSGASIFLISGGNLVNEGSLKCRSSRRGTIYINIDGVFHNKGLIDAGEGGSVQIRCAEYKNDGQINPQPKVMRKHIKLNRRGVELLISQSHHKFTKLELSSHRGHFVQKYGSYHPNHLLEDGTKDYYKSKDNGPPAEDWMIFRTLSREPVFPTSIGIRNYEHDSGLKVVKIQGSADGWIFVDWIQIKNISKKDNEIQIFTVDPRSGYFAWERAFTYFKLLITENHGARCNQFYEFRVNGMDGK